MTPHLACPMHESSQIGDARRQAAGLAAELGFDEVAAGRLALMVTELSTNLVRHAREGLLLIGRHDGPHGTSIELLSIDAGPGIRNIDDSLTDGVSTFGSAGTGLGAVRRLANQFAIFSKLGDGTIILARVASSSETGAFGTAAAESFSFGAICLAAPRESQSGDAWAFRQTDKGAALLVADGLGHGPDAAEAADAAVRVFDAKASAAPKELLEAAHGALRSTRGAAMAVVNLDIESRRVTFCGAGNISARLISGVQDRSLMSQHGTVGLQIRRMQEMQYEWHDHAVLVMHSDGLQSRWHLRDMPELLGCDAMILAAWLIRGQLRGRDDATVAVVRLH